jgi:colicin import membrane protein
MLTELDLAQRLAEGALPSPQRIENSYLVALRVSGTGCAWREGHGEFAWREPAVWLSETMMRRVLGLPVVVEHPPSGDLLTLEYVRQAIIGVMAHSYIRDAELWGIARLFSREAAEAICDPEGFEVDTSPCVTFAPGTTSMVEIAGRNNGYQQMLVEPAPLLLDHLAIVITPKGEAGGVWSKGEAGAGAEQMEIA